MNQQPDKLFRDKLQGYQKPASPEAWNRVASKVHKRDPRALWLKVAAGILLLATAGIFIYPAMTPGTVEVVAEKSAPPKKQEQSMIETPGAEQNEKVKKDDGTSSPSFTQKDNGQDIGEKSPKKYSPKKQSNKPSPSSNMELTAQSPDKDDPGASIDSTAHQHTTVVPESPLAQANNKARNVTIVFSAQEVNEKYLTKKSTVQATSEEKEPSTLKKLLNKASDLKHNQDPLGDLRQKKNEILAFNFKNDKQRDENK